MLLGKNFIMRNATVESDLVPIEEIDISKYFTDEGATEDNGEGDGEEDAEIKIDVDLDEPEEKVKPKKTKSKVKEEEEDDDEDDDEEDDEEEEDDDEEDDEEDDEARKKSPKYKKYIAKKEKALRKRESDLKSVVIEIEKREEAINKWVKDTDFTKAVEVGRLIKQNKISEAFEMLGIDEAAILEYYDLQDSDIVSKTIDKAKILREQKALKRQQEELELQQRSTRAYNELSDTVIQKADSFPILKHFETKDLVQEIFSSANKLASERPDIVKGKTVEEITTMVMEGLDKAWGQRFKSIRKERALQKKSKKKMSGKKEVLNKKTNKVTLSSKNTKTSGGGLKNIKWSPDIDQDEFDEAMINKFLKK